MPTILKKSVIDPEPFTVIVGIAGIVGGVASIASAFKMFAPDSTMPNRRKALELLDRTADELRYLSADIATIRETLEEAEISDDRRFRLETTAFLNSEQFRRYERATDDAFGRLRKLLKFTNKLDRLLPRLPAIRLNAAAQQIEGTRGRLNRVIRDSDISMREALNDLSAAALQVQQLVDGLRSDLQG